MFEPIVKEGVGLHTGVHTRVELETGQPGRGAVLVVDGKEFYIAPENIASPSRLSTTLCHQEKSVSTVEHLFSALNAYGELDVQITVEGPEIPILDGSALPWAEALESNGCEQTPRFVRILEEVTIELDGSLAKVTPIGPEEAPSIFAEIEYEGPVFCKQEATYYPLSSNFLKEIAPARTFAFESEVEQIRSRGLGIGGSLDNALVIGTDGPLNPGGLRFDNEPARHKLLDALGDLFLLGGIPWAKVELRRPGHDLMHVLVRQLKPLCQTQTEQQR